MWRSLLLAVALVSRIAAQPPADAFQVGSASGLQSGDVLVNLTTNTNNICANTYVFDQYHQMQACCSSFIYKDQTVFYSAQQDLISNTFTGVVPNSITIMLLATVPVLGGCNAGLPAGVNLAAGMAASFTAPVVYDGQPSFVPFQPEALPSDLSTFTATCGAWSAGYSYGYGLCRAARLQQTSSLTFNGYGLPQAIAGQPYTATLLASGGAPPYAWSISSGELPLGFTLDSGTGVISSSGSPTALPGTYVFSVVVTDSQQNLAAGPVSLTVVSGGFVCPGQTGQATITEYPVTTAGSQPQGIAAGRDGNLWFTEASGNNIGRITTAGATTEFPLSTANSQPNGIAVGPDGNLWFTESSANKIGTIAYDTGSITEYSIPTAGGQPVAIASGPDGNLWFTELAGNKIGRLSSFSGFTEYSIPTAGSQPVAIASGPDGNLWFTENNSGKIGRITTKGVITEFWVPGGSQPYGIAAGSDGNLWFTEPGSNNIGQITTAGVVAEFPIPTANSQPQGIAAGPDAYLWFTELAGNKVGRIGTSGFIAEWPVPTAGSQPFAIAAGADGNLWFTEASGNQVAKAQTGCQSPNSPRIAATSGGGQNAALNTAFASPLVATVMDSAGNPVSGIAVRFQTPGSSGASATFSGLGWATVITGPNGQAVSPVLTANATAGTFTVTATAPGVSAPANFLLTGGVVLPASIAATSGTPQSATINAQFSAPLVATVKDSGGNPMGGVTVTFTAPTSGPSGKFAGGVNTATTNASGMATSASFTANSVVGNYVVNATVSGLAASAGFALSNMAGAPTQMTANAGSTPQSATVGASFGHLLAVAVTDSGNNPVPSVSVTFAAPSSGASGTFANGTNTTQASTNANGVATATAFTANSQAGGPYNVVASASGLTPVNFALTNTAGAPASIAATSGAGQSTQIDTMFASPLVATVQDSFGNPLPGLIVTFMAPATGASGTFASGVNTATTNAAGAATSAMFTANATPGSYVVNAQVSGVTTPAGFRLTNTGIPVLTITTAALASGQVGVFYSRTLAATGGTGAYTWTVSSGRLPNGLSLNPSTGVISGTPASVSASLITFRVTDSGSPAQTATVNLTMTIQLQGPVSITTAALANGRVGVPYSQTLTAAGGQTPYIWSLISGVLPGGLTLGASTGVIGGTPSVTVSNLSLTFRVTDSSTPPQAATATLTLTIATAVLSITTTSLPNAQAGVAYSQTVFATGGTGPYAWSAPGLPANLSINAATGAITGTPAAAGIDTVSVTVRDSGSPQQTATKSFSLTILGSGGPLVIATTSLAPGQVGVSYLQTLAATGGTGAYTWTVSSGRLPNGLSLNPSTGVISGTPTSVSGSLMTFRVTDSGSPAQTATVTLTTTVN
jgi:streptogramin lyase